jgi:hypothetical protein
MSFQDRAWPFRHARVAVASRPCGAAEKRPCFSSSWKNIPDLQTPPTRIFGLRVKNGAERCYAARSLKQAQAISVLKSLALAIRVGRLRATS